jgi:hypothetical protein
MCEVCEDTNGLVSNVNLGICESICGDSIVMLGEGCDDGNLLDGDG